MLIEKSEFFEKAISIMNKGFVCDNCLGRQFAQLLNGLENKERGKSIRDLFAMLLESGKNIEVDMSNFYDYNFRFSDIEKKEKECSVCCGIFNELDFFANKAKEKLSKIEFSNFLVGTKISGDMLRREESLWEDVGIEWCEPIKSEINRLVGKKLEKELRKHVEFKKPEVTVLIDIDKKDVELQLNSIYIYGEYNKLVRNLPQTRWPSGKYKNSVEQIIAKPVLKITKGTGSKFHGAGREDIDAKCFGWRPFVLEITEPARRKIKTRKLLSLINESKRVSVKNLRIVGSEMVEKVKSIRPDKTYKAVVVTKNNIKKESLDRLSILRGKKIYQETPERVLHRRADKLRKRVIKDLKWKMISKRKFSISIKAEAGTYIKEFVSGDKGRTYPSVSEVIGTGAEVKKLDVIKVHHEL